MKNLFLIALLLLTVGSFAQTEFLLFNNNEIKFAEIMKYPRLQFGGTNNGFTIDFKNDSMIVESQIPMNEAGKLLAKFAMDYYTHYTDSLKNEIADRNFYLLTFYKLVSNIIEIQGLDSFSRQVKSSTINLLDSFNRPISNEDKNWLDQQKKELKLIIK